MHPLKLLLLLLAAATPLRAELLARVATTKGEIVVELRPVEAPRAVANFITLAQGTRSRIDEATGAVIRKPMYVGEKFFRVVNTATFKIVQTGSGTGTNSGGPGFTFKDEFTPALRHVPYVLSMANSGPNTNGSQIFFTGDATIPSLDDVHTVFGLVKDPASRAVVDAIHAAGNDGSSITGISFERTDAAALAFNEFAQGLPTVTRPRGKLAVVRNTAATWLLDEPPAVGDIFRAFRSTTLAAGSWAELPAARLHLGILPPEATATVPPLKLNSATAEKEFFNLSYARHPGAVGISSLAGRVLAIEAAGGVITYEFNAAGTAGDATYQPDSGSPLDFTFTAFNFSSTAHAFNVIVDQSGINPRYLLIKMGCDSATGTQIDGRHATSFYTGVSWEPWDSGFAATSR